MSSDCPPQLQLTIQPTTTSFKRSFEEFGFDLESPVGGRIPNPGGSGTSSSPGNERHKRARSTNSRESESSVTSQATDDANTRASVPAEPPRLQTPVLHVQDIDMPEDEGTSFPPQSGPQTHVDDGANTFQLTLERFSAFDREIDVLRQSELATSPSSSSSSLAHVVPTSPPVLPPLIINDTEFLQPTIPVSMRESLGLNPESATLFRQNLDVALERLRSPSPLVPGYVVEDSPESDEDTGHRGEDGPPTLPPITLIDDDSDFSDRVSGSARTTSNPPTLPPIPSISDQFSDMATPDVASSSSSSLRMLLSGEHLMPYYNWIPPATEDGQSTSSVSTSAATAGTEREPFSHAPTVTAASPPSPTSPPNRFSRSSVAAGYRAALAARLPPTLANLSDNPFTLRRAATDITSETSALDNSRYRLRSRSQWREWEERIDRALEIEVREDWSQFRDRLASEIEATENLRRLQPRYLGDAVHSLDNPTNSLSGSRSNSAIMDTANDVASTLGAAGSRAHRQMDSPSTFRSGQHQQAELEAQRRTRFRRMLESTPDDTPDFGSSDFLNELFSQVGSEDREDFTPDSSSLSSRWSRRPEPQSTSSFRQSDHELRAAATAERNLRPDPNVDMAQDYFASMGEATQQSDESIPERRTAAHRQGGNGQLRARPVNTRPGPSNSLMAESASEARRLADFDSIRRRIRPPEPSNVWQDFLGWEDAQDAMDVDEDYRIRFPRNRAFRERPSSPPIRIPDNIGRLGHESYEDWFEPSPVQTGPMPPTNPESFSPFVPDRARDFAYDNDSQAHLSTANIMETSRMPRPPHMRPWELPDASLPFGDLFESLGESRTRYDNAPQASSSERRRASDPPSLPHPDLGNTFSGHRYSSVNQDAFRTSDTMDLEMSERMQQLPHFNRTEPQTVHSTVPTAEFPSQSLVDRHRIYLLARQREGRRLEEVPMRRDDLRFLRRAASSSLTRHSSTDPNNNATAISAATALNSGPSSRPSATTSALPAGYRSRTIRPPTSHSREEVARAPSYSHFMPGPFRNTLQHVQERQANADSLRQRLRASTSQPATAPSIPHMPFDYEARNLASRQMSEGGPSSGLDAQSHSSMRPTRIAVGRPRNPAPMAELDRQQERQIREYELLRMRQRIRRPSGSFSTDAYSPQQRQIRELELRHLEHLRRRTGPPTPEDVVDPAPAGASVWTRYGDARSRAMEAAGEQIIGDNHMDGDYVRWRSGPRLEANLRIGQGMSAAARMRRSRFMSDYMRDEDVDLLSYESLLSLSDLAGDVRPKATAPDVLEKMEKATYKEWSTSDSDTRCPICLDDYQPDDPVQKLTNCSHWLHQECLNQWLNSANTCPVCRGSVADPSSSGSRRSGQIRSFSGFNRRRETSRYVQNTMAPHRGIPSNPRPYRSSVNTLNNMRSHRVPSTDSGPSSSRNTAATADDASTRDALANEENDHTMNRPFYENPDHLRFYRTNVSNRSHRAHQAPSVDNGRNTTSNPATTPTTNDTRLHDVSGNSEDEATSAEWMYDEI